MFHFKCFPMMLMFLMVAGMFSSCTVRDDWPVFDDVNVTGNTPPPAESQESISTWYLQTLEDNNNYTYASFIADTLTVIEEGLTYVKLRFIDRLSNNIQMHVVELDLTNPNFSVVSMLPYGLKLPNFQGLSGMAADNDPISGGEVMIALNGTLGSTAATTYGRPSYGTVAMGTVLMASTSITQAYLGVDLDDNVFIGNRPTTAYTGIIKDQTELKQQLSGNYWCIFDDYTYTAAQTGAAARTVIGLNETDQKLYLIVIDGGNASLSAGMGLASLSYILRDWGINKAFQVYFLGYSEMLRRQVDENGKVSFPVINSLYTARLTFTNGLAIVRKK